MPSSDGGDDFVWIGDPGEGPWIAVGLGEEAVDGGLKVDDRSEDAALQAAFGQLGEEALNGVEPGAGGRHEVEGEARVAVEPDANLRVLVGGVVVEDDVHHLPDRHLTLDVVEEADELLMAVALHAAADDRAVQDVERGEQGGRAMALVVMVPARPFFMGSPGWVRSRAWIWDFSSTDNTTAWAGGST